MVSIQNLDDSRSNSRRDLFGIDLASIPSRMGIRKRILILDDEPSITFSLASCLQPEGMDVIACNDSVAAMRAMAGLRVDAIIADIRLSVINPYEAIQFIQHVRSLHFDLPMIMMSGTDEMKSEVMHAGATCFLQKPLDVDRLVALLKRLDLRDGSLQYAN